MRNTLVTLGITASVLVLTNQAAADGNWNDPTEVRLKVSGAMTVQPMEYLIELLSDGDARITEMDGSTSPDLWPAIVLVGGQVMMVQNLELKERYEIDALDGPVLMLQLVLALLERGITDGPESLPTVGSVKVQRAEQDEPIEVSTTSAGGAFPAPWHLSGTANRSHGNRIAYSLDFSYTSGSEKPTIEIAGHWQRMEPRPRLDPEMDLSGFKYYQIGPIERTHPGGTIYDFGAQPKEFKARNLRELRLEISAR